MHKHLAPGSPATQSDRPRTRAPEKVRRPGRERIRKTASSTIRVRSLQQLLIAHGARIWHRHLAGRRAVRGTPPAKRQKWNIAAPIKRHATVAPKLTPSRSATRQQRQSSLKEPRQSAHTSPRAQTSSNKPVRDYIPDYSNMVGELLADVQEQPRRRGRLQRLRGSRCAM